MGKAEHGQEWAQLKSVDGGAGCLVPGLTHETKQPPW